MYEEKEQDQRPQRRISGEEGRGGESEEIDPGAAGGDRSIWRTEAVGYIYFFGTADGEFVKIGFSNCPTRRLAQLGTLRPSGFRLVPLGYLPGSTETERWLHSKFAPYRDNGEWFRRVATVQAFIDAVGLISEVGTETIVPRSRVHIIKQQSKEAVTMARQRMKKISPERRKEIAQNAARVRWAKVLRYGEATA